MNINDNTFFDYIDGILSAEEIREFEKYLQDNPNAKKKLDNSRLKLGKVTYQQNEDLVPYTVLDQSVSPGTVLNKSSQINLIVSVLNLQDIFDSIQNQK